MLLGETKVLIRELTARRAIVTREASKTMMQIKFYHLCELAIVCISVSFFSCEGKISAEPIRGRRQQEETGACFNVSDCEFAGGVYTDSLVTFDDCCNKIGGKSWALHNGACRNCIRNGSELSPTVAKPSPNGNSNSINDWTPWGACSHTCGPSGTRSRQKICGPSNKLTVCKEQDQNCNRDVSCPVDGQWGRWSRWSSCSKKCKRSRKRSCNRPKPSDGGNDCVGVAREKTRCKRNPRCQVHGGWSAWTQQSCTKSCGGGFQIVTRQCDNPTPEHGGRDCVGSKVKYRPCNTKCCPVHGHWSKYTSWSNCEMTCGDGQRFRKRKCNNPPPSCDGRNCSGFSMDAEACSPNNCPVDGGWTWWSSWSSCSSTCKGGTQSRTRQCTNPPPRFQGVSCQGVNVDTQTCAKVKCPVDGNWGKWSVWSECSKICETGTRFRSRLCNNPRPDFGGKQCNDPSTGREESLCNTHKCPVNGGWGAWTEYTFCSKTCDTGSQKRTRKCNNPTPKYEGTGCNGNDAESRLCNKFGCPVDGSYTQWTSWAQCSRSCGRGTTERTRHCNLPLNGGRPCLSIGLPQESKVCCKRSCIGTVSYIAYSVVTSRTAIVQRYTVACGIWDLGRCGRSRTVYRQTYARQEKTLYRHATKDSC
ncbi:coadhesin-like [Corticium candelabrum]|uniref:coadhesin-like n=1 Tax=Corticium candelabrum TaxID=121492 RepID=UPI002E25DA91|nr:coadhesin-like [Corticium candelabrum]